MKPIHILTTLFVATYGQKGQKVVIHYSFNITQFNTTIIMTERDIHSRVSFLEEQLPFPARTVTLTSEQVRNIFNINVKPENDKHLDRDRPRVSELFSLVMVIFWYSYHAISSLKMNFKKQALSLKLIIKDFQIISQ